MSTTGGRARPGEDDQYARVLMATLPARTIEEGDVAGALVTAGVQALAARDHERAYDLLRVAVDLGGGEPGSSSDCWYLLGLAAEGLGLMEAARRYLRTSAELAERGGDSSRAVRAAVRCVLPSDWRTDDPELGDLLRRTARLPVEDDERVAIDSVCAIIDMRVSTADQGGQQIGWRTRPELGQPLAERALTESEGCSDATRALALLAWRSTHRGPRWLERRRSISAEVVELASRTGDQRTLVDAGIWYAVDALEAGDRAEFDRTMMLVRAAASADTSPRLVWRTTTVESGIAFMDGDMDSARQHRLEAQRIGRPLDLPGWLGADLFLRAEEAILSNDKSLMEPFVVDRSFDDVDNPIGRAGVAYMAARLGYTQIAVDELGRALRLADEESSYLCSATRTAAAALAIGERHLMDASLQILEPWTDRVSVDTNAWWCDGPVAMWDAALRRALGDSTGATRSLDIAEPLARQIGHAASLRRIELLRLGMFGAV